MYLNQGGFRYIYLNIPLLCDSKITFIFIANLVQYTKAAPETFGFVLDRDEHCMESYTGCQF